jgi:anaerobic magnesium-protoporphyrin IX monomethyl ester cyclase
MGMKVLLVNPPLTLHKLWGTFEKVANVIPPLGIGYIAAVAEKAGFDVEIIDGVPLQIPYPELERRIVAARPAVVGITSTILSARESAATAQRVKRRLPDALVIAGGPHITSCPELAMREPSYDCVALGEGEYTFLEVCQAVERGSSDLSRIKGLVYREGGEIRYSAPRGNIMDLDELPLPARHLFPPLAAYKPLPASWRRWPPVHLFTSRGCPFACSFCDRSVVGKKFRAKSAPRVLEEIRECLERHGAREIRFFDDTFTIDRDRAMQVAEGILRRGWGFPWTVRTRVDMIDKEMLALFKRAGCWQILFGLESGDERMLRALDKGVSMEDNIRAMEWAEEVGMAVRADFIIGAPGETRETIRKTIDFAKRYKALEVANFNLFTPFLGTEFGRVLREKGEVLHEDYEFYRVAIDPRHVKLSYVADGFTEKEIVGWVMRANREFYLRPSYILRQLRGVRSLQDVWRYFRAFRCALGFSTH